VAQVGDLVRFRAEVSNDGGATLERVFVVGFLPPEVRFVSADLLPEVEATLYNRIGDDESVTWNVGEIESGDSLTLTWAGRVTSAGDMTAVSAVRAVADGLPRMRRESSTYLATASNLGGPNPRPEPTTTRIVSYERVPSGSSLGASSGEGGTGVVPETGFDGSLALAVAALSLGLGLLLWWIASPRPGRRRRVALGLAAMALLAACTSGRDVDRASPEPTGSPEVKGRRIGPGGQTRDLGGQGRDGGSGDDGSQESEDGDEARAEPPDDAPTPVEPEPPADDFTVVRTVDVLPVDVFLRPEVRLPSHDGDGAVTYLWNGFGIQGIQPPLADGAHPLVRVHTSLRERGATLEAVVTVTNTSADTPVLVDGRLGLAIHGSAIGRLAAAATTVTLMPGGSTSASFGFDLPHGTYASEGFFDAR
jgi:uncharacterized repeat protein (TIGR01451 family)